MPVSVQFLTRAMGGGQGPDPTWGQLMAEVWPIISSPLSWEGERLLLQIIHFDGRLRLTETPELPHSMPPEEMLKSLAVQALAKWTGLTHLTAMQRVELITSSSALRSVVSAAIHQARTIPPPMPEADAIAEAEPEDDANESADWSSEWVTDRPQPKAGPVRVKHVVGRYGALTFIPGRRAKKARCHEEYELISSAGMVCG